MNAIRPIVFVLGHGWERGVDFRFGRVLNLKNVKQGFQAVRFVVADLLRIVVAEVLADLGNPYPIAVTKSRRRSV